MTETAVRRAITSANTYQHYNRDDPLSQQRRGKLLAMFWLDGASLYLVSVYMMASRIYKFSKIQNFQPQHQPQLGASFSHGLTSVSRVQRRVVILHAKTPIGAYNDVRVEVCIIILERVFHDVLLNSISHQKHLFFQIRSRIWTCGKVLFELDMPHVKQNPSVSQFRCFWSFIHSFIHTFTFGGNLRGSGRLCHSSQFTYYSLLSSLATFIVASHSPFKGYHTLHVLILA